ncbi:MAG: hypothetical protein IJZ38_05795 [Bacteroides sp.]|nr:hypothetical protein [Bacteroides sp.]
MKQNNYTSLRILEHAALDLLHATQPLGTEMAHFSDEIMKSFRKIVIANEFMHRPLICISGLQGAGKTTLVKNLYKLPDELFNIVLGQGERIPILITERKNCSKPILCAVELDGQAPNAKPTRRENMTPEEFKAASKGTVLNRTIMYLEMIVPLTHAHEIGVSFMLLPGYERSTDYWRELVDFSVSCSDAAVFVFNASNFSSADNDRILREIKETFGNKLIYVISHCDELSNDGQYVKETCMQVMDIPQTESDRVVCAGAYLDQQQNDVWVSDLIHSIGKYCTSFEESNNRCVKRIHEEINTRLRPQIWKMRAKLQKDDGNEIQMKLRSNSWLNAFDADVANMRKRYQKILQNAFGPARDNSLEQIKNEFTDRSKWLKNAGRMLFGTSYRDIVQTRELVKNALYSGTNHLNATPEFANALQNFAVSLQKKNKVSRLLLEKKTSSYLMLPGTSQKTALSENASIILGNAQILLAEESGDQLLQNTYSGGDAVKDTIVTIVDMATYYYCMAAVCEPGNVDDIAFSDNPITGKKILEYAQSTKNLGLGLLGIFGFDLVEDGKVNLIAKLAEVLGVTTQAAAIGAAVVIALGVGKAIVTDITRMERADAIACENVIREAYDYMETECLKKYDEYMTAIRSRLEDNLIGASGWNLLALNKYNAQCAIPKIEQVIEDIARQTEGAAYGFGAAFS